MSEMRTNRVSPSTDGPPSGYFLVIPPAEEGEAIDLRAAVRAGARSWLLIGIAVLVGGIATALISLQLRNVFRSQTLLAPVTQNAMGLGRGVGGQLGGLASLVGIDLSTNNSGREEAMATLSSPGLVRDFISSENLLPILFADRWDAARKQWRPDSKQPTLEDGVERFRANVLAISEDRRTGIVTLRVDWYDPTLAAQWANTFVKKANERLRQEAITSSQRSIDFLNQELKKTDQLGLQQAIYSLIESQVNKAMLAHVQEDYAFKVVDRAVPADPKRKVSPHRALMSLGGGAAAGLCALAWALWRARSQWLTRSSRETLPHAAPPP